MVLFSPSQLQQDALMEAILQGDRSLPQLAALFTTSVEALVLYISTGTFAQRLLLPSSANASYVRLTAGMRLPDALRALTAVLSTLEREVRAAVVDPLDPKSLQESRRRCETLGRVASSIIRLARFNGAGVQSASSTSVVRPTSPMAVPVPSIAAPIAALVAEPFANPVPAATPVSQPAPLPVPVLAAAPALALVPTLAPVPVPAPSPLAPALQNDNAHATPLTPDNLDEIDTFLSQLESLADSLELNLPQPAS